MSITSVQELKVGQVWKNARSGFTYRVTSLPQWSDTPEDRDPDEWVVLTNTTTGVDYVRSQESFRGTNRYGAPRFLPVSEPPSSVLGLLLRVAVTLGAIALAIGLVARVASIFK